MTCARRQRASRTRSLVRVAVLLALVLLALLAFSGALGAFQDGLLQVSPAIALAVLMLTRPYLGETAIARLRERLATRRPPGAKSSRAQRAPARVIRGGRLIASALAGRAPPRALAA